ncbi:MAG: TIGR03085 family metal-binding protein [Candidatus Nanopelagicales bacterium]
MKAGDAARSERQQLCDLLVDLGPEAPTLCAGWTTRDLAAHLVVREGRPDAALGILGGPLTAHLESVQASAAARPWPDLVRSIRMGPPAYSPMRYADGLANLFEYAIHHEDVRRAQPGWQPRLLPPGEQDLIWSRLSKAARLLCRRCPVGLVLQRSGSGERIVAKKGTPSVTLVGEPLELLLRLYGRREVVVDVQGEGGAVQAFETARFGV